MPNTDHILLSAEKYRITLLVGINFIYDECHLVDIPAHATPPISRQRQKLFTNENFILEEAGLFE